ncbi:MAG: hypothetical protein AAFV93_07505 [Chloroflexota bacterium]
MSNLNRDDMKARYILFHHFALDDQRNYYEASTEKYQQSARGVNIVRATISLLTGVASAGVGLVVAMNLNDCSVNLDVCTPWANVIHFLIICATALPAFAAFFNMLADLYQWDKLIAIYEAANENIELADAHSPTNEMNDAQYLASLHAYSQGTLDVMSDETAQWGQSIRTPKGMKEYLEKAEKRAREVGGSADQHQLGGSSTDESDSTASSPADPPTPEI